MSPSPSVTSRPLPPLPDLSAPKGAGGGAPAAPGSDPLASILSGIAPVKNAVDQIQQACQMVVQSGAIPGAEQICGQIVTLATSLLPMAAQNMLQPGAGAAPPGGPPGGMQMMPPPGGPPSGPPPIG
jgi:hypothetical protein